MADSLIPRAEMAFLLDTRNASDPEVLEPLVAGYAEFVAELIAALNPAARKDPDLLQSQTADTFIRAVRGQREFEGADRIRVWLARHALDAARVVPTRNKAVRLLGRSRRDRYRAEASRTAIATDQTNSRLQSLEDRTQTLIIFRYAAGFSIHDIAQTLNVPKRAVLEALFQARTQLLSSDSPQAATLDPTGTRSVHAAFDASPGPGDPAEVWQLVDKHPEYEPLIREVSKLEDTLLRLFTHQAIERSRPLQVESLLRRITSNLQERASGGRQAARLPIKEISWIVLVSLGFLLVSQWLVPAEVEAPASPAPLALPTQALITVGDAVASGGAAGNVLWVKSKTFIPNPSSINSLDYSPDGRYLAIGYADSWVRIWGFFDESRLINLRGQGSPITVVQYSPDGDYLIAGSEDGVVRLWETDFFRNPVTLDDRGGAIRGAAFSPDSRLLAVIGDQRLWLWEIRDGAFVRFYERAGEQLTSVAFSPRGDYVALADGRTVTVLLIEDFSEVLTYLNHEQDIVRLAFSIDGRKIASASADGMVQLVHLVSPAEGLLDGHLAFSFRHPVRIDDVTFTPEGNHLVATTGEGTAYFWDPQSGALTSLLEEGGRGITFSPDGRNMATIAEENSILVWKETE